MSRPLLATLAVTALAASLAGCSTGSTSAPSSPATSGSAARASAFPVTIKHTYGSTTINAAPSRIATLGWSDQDVVLALGQAPVGAVKITWGGNKAFSTPWFDSKLAVLGATAPTRYADADGAPIEEVAKLSPDLILATNSGLTKEEYTKLSKIAPVVAFPEEAWGTPWQTSLTMIGQALGKPAEAAALETSTTEAIAAAAKKYPQTQGKSFIFGSITATDTSKINYYTALDNRPRLLSDLGMVNAPIVKKTSTGSEFFKTISAEQASTLDADVFITYTAAEGEMKTFLADPLLSQIPAFKTGAYVDAANQTDALGMSAPSPLSIPWAMDKFVPLVAAAIDRAAQ